MTDDATDKLGVLVVDDEPGMRAGVERAMRRFAVRLEDINGEIGFETRAAESAEQALEMIAERAPDILLLDYKLPGMTGLEMLDRLGDRRDEMLTVMITAYASLETAVSATKRGAYDFLAKPFTPDELKAAVRKAARHIMLQRQARRLAEEKRRVRFEFIRVLGHELKAPLSAIEGYLRIMKDRAAGDQIGDYDKMVGRSLDRLDGMRKLITDLLDLTRIESGQKRRELAEVDLREIAERSIETNAPAAGESDLTMELHADAPQRMYADPGEIEIILNNLISNAVKYNRPGGRVDVTLAGDEETVRIEVADTGIGMEPEDAERLFEEFVRIRNDKTRDILGSGLGLSILRKLTGLYGGDVRVESEPDVGSTFTVTLRRDAREADDEPAASDAEHANHANRTDQSVAGGS